MKLKAAEQFLKFIEEAIPATEPGFHTLTIAKDELQLTLRVKGTPTITIHEEDLHLELRDLVKEIKAAL